MPVVDAEVANHFISKSKEVEKTFPYEARCWLLMGKSLLSSNFDLQVLFNLFFIYHSDMFLSKGANECGFHLV